MLEFKLTSPHLSITALSNFRPSLWVVKKSPSTHTLCEGWHHTSVSGSRICSHLLPVLSTRLVWALSLLCWLSSASIVTCLWSQQWGRRALVFSFCPLCAFLCFVYGAWLLERCVLPFGCFCFGAISSSKHLSVRVCWNMLMSLFSCLLSIMVGMACFWNQFWAEYLSQHPVGLHVHEATDE